MSHRVLAAAIATVFAALLSSLLYFLWGQVYAASLPYLVVACSAGLIAIGIAIGEHWRLRFPSSRIWLLPNIASFVLSLPIAMPYDFDPGMPLCMVSTAVVTGAFHASLLANRILRKDPAD